MDDLKDQLSYQPVKERIKPIYGKHQEIFPPKIDNWFAISPAQNQQLQDYIQQVYVASHNKNEAGLNPKEKATLDKHLQVMHAYYDVLWQYPGFKEYFEKQGINREFFTALVNIHDFSRYIFNGSYPLRYTDCVSDGLIGKLFPTFPKQHLHSIGWLTGEEPAPSSTIVDSLTPVEQVSGLVLKAIDTLGKIEPEGNLRNPTDFFAKGKGYDKWLEYQKQMGRFPFPVLLPSPTGRVRHLVTADEYAEKDKELTELGLKMLTKLTGEKDQSQIVKKASEQICKKS